MAPVASIATLGLAFLAQVGLVAICGPFLRPEQASLEPAAAPVTPQPAAASCPVCTSCPAVPGSWPLYVAGLVGFLAGVGLCASVSWLSRFAAAELLAFAAGRVSHTVVIDEDLAISDGPSASSATAAFELGQGGPVTRQDSW